MLQEAGALTGAAEMHGIVTGMLTAPKRENILWKELILGRDAGSPSVDLIRMLDSIFRLTEEHLKGVECDFAPLLPGDHFSLLDQVDGLSDWCRGYLIGLHASGVNTFAPLPGEAGEFVQDIARIAEAESNDALDDEAERRALVEIVEYIRVGVQLVFDEMQPPVARH